MLEQSAENPFLNLRARSLFLCFFLWSSCFGLLLVALESKALQSDPLLDGASSFLVVIALCLVTLWQMQRLGISLKYLLGSFPRRYPFLSLLSLVIALLLFSLGTLLLFAYVVSRISPEFLKSWIESSPNYQVQESAFPGLCTIVLGFFIIVFAPIAEEFLFRGILLHRWATKWGVIPGILFSSLLFGFLHVNPIGLTLFGIVMALLYLKTRTLVIPMLAHALNNTIAFGLGFIPTDDGLTTNASNLDSYLLPGLLCVAISTPFLGYFIYKYFPNRRTLLPYFANQSESVEAN